MSEEGTAAAGGAPAVSGSSAGAPAINPYFALRQHLFPWERPQVGIPVARVIVGPSGMFAVGLVAHAPLPVLLALLLVTPALETLLALRLRDAWSAQEVLGWLDWKMLRDWSDRADGRRPRTPSEAQAWLAGHAEGSVPADLRAGMLVFTNRLTEAHDAIDALPINTPGERRRRLELEIEADAFWYRPLDTSAADDAVRSDPELSPAEVTARLAYHAALAAVARGGDGAAGLAAARPTLGRLPADLVRRLWLARLRYALAAAFVGAWLLVAMLVAASSASGTVLY